MRLWVPPQLPRRRRRWRGARRVHGVHVVEPVGGVNEKVYTLVAALHRAGACGSLVRLGRSARRWRRGHDHHLLMIVISLLALTFGSRNRAR